MRASVFAHTLSTKRRSIIGYSIGCVALIAWVTAAYPIIRDSEAFEGLIERFPPAMMALLSIDPDTFLTAAGYLQAQFYALFAPLIVMFFVIGSSANATAAEERDATMDMLLSVPISRHRVVLEKFAVVVVGSFIIVASITVSLLILNPIVDLELTPNSVIAANVSMWLLVVLFGAVTLMAGAFSGTPTTARTVGGIAAFLAWFVNGFAPLYTWLSGPSKISPFTWYLNNNPFIEGWGSGHVWLILVAAAVVLAAAWLFARRDIATEQAVLPKRATRFQAKSHRKPRAVWLLSSVYGKTVWERRRSMVGWSIGFGFLIVAVFAAWPAMSEDADALRSLISAMPREIFAIFGMTEPEALTTPAGFASSRAYLSVGPIALALFTVSSVSSTLVRPEATGTLDLLLSNPVSRRHVLQAKALGIVTVTLVVVVVTTIVAFVGAARWGLDLEFGNVIAANVGLALLGLCFGGLTMAFWAMRTTSLSATRLTLIIAVATFFLNGIGSLADVLAPVRWISPFYWYFGDVPPLAKGFEPAYLLLLGVAVGGAWIAFSRFEHRDLAV